MQNATLPAVLILMCGNVHVCGFIYDKRRIPRLFLLVKQTGVSRGVPCVTEYPPTSHCVVPVDTPIAVPFPGSPLSSTK